MWDYTDKVKEHFLSPRNVGELEDANAIGEVGSLACGDALKLFLKVDENEVIQDARFQTFGCASAIASSSALTEMIKGMTLEEASKVTNKDITEYLGGLPKEKMHCSVMGQEALEAAIKNYRGETVEAHDHAEGKLVCKCFGVTDLQILRAIEENGLTTVEEVTNFTKAGGGCGECVPEIERLLAQAQGKPPVAECKDRKLSNLERMRLVDDLITREIRPSLQKDGGDIELVDIEGAKVKVALRGACTTCRMSQITLKDFVEHRLREAVDENIVVEEVR